MHLIHELKILEEYYRDVIAGSKKAEFRIFDRDFKVGDLLCLREWSNGEYTGSQCHVLVTHILPIYHTPNAWAVLSIEFFDSSRGMPRWSESTGWECPQ